MNGKEFLLENVGTPGKRRRLWFFYYHRGWIVLENYLPVLIFIIIGVAFGCVPIAASYLIGPKKPDEVKNSPYECGFPAFEDARVPFEVKYYLIAILFILFDLETAFFFPWAVVLNKIGWFGF